MKKVKKLEAEVKSLTAKLDAQSRTRKNSSSDEQYLDELQNENWKLKSEKYNLTLKNQEMLRQIENADYEGHWAKQYDKLFDSQGSYEKGLRDGSLNHASIYQQKIDDIQSVSDFYRNKLKDLNFWISTKSLRI